MPDTILSCPTCKEEVAKHIPKLECFQKVMYLNDDNMPEEVYRAEADHIKVEMQDLESAEVVDAFRPLSKERLIKASREYIKKIPKLIASGRLSNDELRGWIQLVIKRVWVKGNKVMEIEPRDDFKPLFVATSKVYNQRPLGPPSPKSMARDHAKPTFTGRFCWGRI